MLAFLEAVPDREPRGTVLCVHGYPESSHMWRTVLEAAAGAGWRAIAPDLLGFGHSPVDPPHTWERQVEALQELHATHDLGPVVLVVHDWGGLIGLRWACDHPASVRALVISDTGFFPDGRWHGLAEALRTQGQGEELVDSLTRQSFGQMLQAVSPSFEEAAIDHYWLAYTEPERRRGQLELYRSGDFEKLAPYEGKLAALGVPALLLWGEDDPFAPVAGARRLEAELPGARLQVLAGAGHFVYDEQPEATAAAVTAFLDGLGDGR